MAEGISSKSIKCVVCEWRQCPNLVGWRTLDHHHCNNKLMISWMLFASWVAADMWVSSEFWSHQTWEWWRSIRRSCLGRHCPSRRCCWRHEWGWGDFWVRFRRGSIFWLLTPPAGCPPFGDEAFLPAPWLYIYKWRMKAKASLKIRESVCKLEKKAKEKNKS